METTVEQKESLKIQVFATMDLILIAEDGTFESNTFGELVCLCAQAVLMEGEKPIKIHRFESNPFFIKDLSVIKWQLFTTQVTNWCKDNKDKFKDVCLIPPKIRLKEIEYKDS